MAKANTADTTPAETTEATANMTPAETTAAQADTTPAPDPNDPRRMVKIKLRKIKGAGKGKYVSVNNHRFFIPYGKECEIPYFIKAILDNQETQDEETAEMIEGYAPDEE